MDELGYRSVCVTGEFTAAEHQKHCDYTIPIEKPSKAFSEMGSARESEFLENWPDVSLKADPCPIDKLSHQFNNS